MPRKPSVAQPPLLRRFMDGQLKEREWQKQVEEALDTFGWEHWHVPPNVVVCPSCHRKIYRGIKKGFPDLFCLKEPYPPVWIELKRERGQLEAEQKQMHRTLRACGQIVIHARPRDREQLFDVLAHPEKAAAWC